MRSRRWAVFAGLVAVVVWLHGWGALRWASAAPALVPAATRLAAVQVVWRAPAPSAEAGLVEPAGMAVEPPAPAQPVPRARPTLTAAASVGADHAPAAVAPVTVAPTAPAEVLEALETPVPDLPAETPVALALDALHAVADTDVAATESSGPADRPRPTVPTYRTRIPPAALVSYRMSRSGLAGTGELDWRPDGGAYTLRLEGQLPLIGTLITQTSRGRFDAAGLAPERFTDKRLRRGEQAANFQRAEGVVSFSGQNPAVPLTPGVQDRLSVMVQLAAIAAAWSKPPAIGTPLQVRVVGARGDANVWSLRFEGADTVETPAGAVPALRFLREGDGPHDTRAEFWLDPARSHLPVRVRISDGGSDPFELLRLK